MAILEIVDDFDLNKIYESGQCFRWKKLGDSKYFINYRDYILIVENIGNNQYNFKCPDGEVGIWCDYFNTQTNFSNIRSLVDGSQDKFLYDACEAGKGLRILHQDAWETLISFIISQNRNIPAIKKSINYLCILLGNHHKIKSADSFEYYTFPTPEQILAGGRKELEKCSLGYRLDYVLRAAEKVHNNEINLGLLYTKDVNTVVRELKTLYGVGDKVANCVALFGLKKLNAFPVDVWVQRIIDDKYNGCYPYNRYTPYNGVYQQYMFEYYRRLNNKR